MCVYVRMYYVCTIYIRTCQLAYVQIEKGELHASIDQVSGMVAFHDSPEKYCTDAVVARIDQQVRVVMRAAQWVIGLCSYSQTLLVSAPG